MDLWVKPDEINQLLFKKKGHIKKLNDKLQDFKHEIVQNFIINM